MRIMRVLSTALLAAFAATAIARTSPETSEAAATLDVRVALVAADLTLRPVPRAGFVIRTADADAGAMPDREVGTGFDGSFRVELPAGSYRVLSVTPVELDGKAYTWDLPITLVAGASSALELSNDNAASAPSPPSRPALTDEGALYQRYKGSVFKVLADSSHGSGFLVSGDGLILTNHHVVADSRYLAVRFEDGRKHEARVLAEDARRDIAIVQVHPDTVAGLTVLPLAEEAPDQAHLSVGQRVLAIGSPLSTETLLTSGLVSKIENEAIFSDVNINPGNSGGPLLDLLGRVVGITTFGIGGGSGPGVAGIVRIHLAQPLIAEAAARIASGEPPSGRRLPEAAAYRFSPEEVRRMAQAAAPKPRDYHVEVGKFDVWLRTPIAAAADILRTESEAAAARDKRMRKKGRGASEPAEATTETDRGFYEWQKNSENFRPSVFVRIDPEVKIKTGSAFLAATTGLGAKYRFKADFDRMELWRGAELIEPIHPGRMRVVVNAGNAVASMKDVGYFGYYEYPPEAFREGAPLVLKVWMQGEAAAIETPIDPTLVQRVAGDFTPYFAQAPPG